MRRNPEDLNFVSYSKLDEFIEEDDSKYLLSEMSSKVKKYLRASGFYFDRKGIYFSLSGLDKLEDFADSVISEYSTGGRDIWKKFGLGSDEDVDYSGTYLEEVARAIRKYRGEEEEEEFPPRKLTSDETGFMLMSDFELEGGQVRLYYNYDENKVLEESFIWGDPTSFRSRAFSLKKFDSDSYGEEGNEFLRKIKTDWRHPKEFIVGERTS